MSKLFRGVLLPGALNQKKLIYSPIKYGKNRSRLEVREIN